MGPAMRCVVTVMGNIATRKPTLTSVIAAHLHGGGGGVNIHVAAYKAQDAGIFHAPPHVSVPLCALFMCVRLQYPLPALPQPTAAAHCHSPALLHGQPFASLFPENP